MNCNNKALDDQISKILSTPQKDYGRGMRKLRGILDLNQKEMAAKLGMPPQQLSVLEKKEEWTEEQLERVSKACDIPMSGLDLLATDSDALRFFITNNTLGDGGIIGQNNFHNTYHFGDADKIEQLFDRFEGIVKEWSVKVEGLEKQLNDYKKK